MKKFIYSTILIIILCYGISQSFGVEPGPPKSELGSKENPYYTKGDDQISLKQYFDFRHKALEDLMDARLKAMDEAVKLAKTSMERRLDGMNEFRATLKDQASGFVTRTELLTTVVGFSAVMFGIFQFMSKRKKEE